MAKKRITGMQQIAALALGLCVVLTACGEKTERAAELTARDRAQLAEKADPSLTEAWNGFGMELVRQVMSEKPDGNVILSPASVSQALAMTWNGAAGSTREAMADAMKLRGFDMAQVHQHAGVMAELFGKSTTGITMSMANSLWLQKDWPFRKPFLEEAGGVYRAKLERRELGDPKVRKEINQWVKTKTNGRIPQMIDQPIDGSAKLLLVNAFYLNAVWETPFEQSATRNGGFTQTNGAVTQVPMMHRKGRYAYDETEEYQAVRLPYGEGQLSMLVVLPKTEADRAALAGRLFADPAWWTKRYESYAGELTLPRFRIELNLPLKDILSKMGMADAFDPNKADFSGMADTDPAHPPLYINQVLHKTFLEVQEKGTEAAASTAVEMKAGSAPPGGSFTMTVDRPFWFAITDDQSHAVLFAGTVERIGD